MSGSAIDLAAKHCEPCRGGVPPLQGEELSKFSKELPDWRVVDGHHIEKTFLFPDFKAGLGFVNRVGALSEEQAHHPDVCLRWGSVQVITYTHKIKGLSQNDFILAAKIDQLYCGVPQAS